MPAANTIEEKLKYSKVLSSLFCSISILAYSILCMLNNLSLDLYSMIMLLKVVIPAAFCFWFLGKAIGTILDNYSNKITTKKIIDETKAYEIPSIFSDSSNAAASEESEGVL